MIFVQRQKRWLLHYMFAEQCRPRPLLFIQSLIVQHQQQHKNQHQTTTTTYRGVFSSAVQTLLDTSLQRHQEIMEEMKGSGFTPANLGKELSSLSTVVNLYKARLALADEQVSYTDLLQEAVSSGDNADLEKECQTELARIAAEQAAVEARIIDAVIPADHDDYESDAVIEIRAGTGGDEAALFAADLWDCYLKTAKALRWKVDVLTESRTDLGGIKEGSVVVSGGAHYSMALDDENDSLGGQTTQTQLLGPYGVFKFESGVHRVQRVPVNDTRIHTSACSIAVLPSIDQDSNDQELLPMSELKIETMRAHGAGGQHINTTDSAVRITHVPTGIQAAIQDERSQHKNKAKALKLVAARVRDVRRAELERQLGATRSSLMGGGDRSERIRTFNFPQDRVTDHRCKESNHGIAALLNGGQDDGLVVTFLPFLRAMRRAELLQQLEHNGKK